MARTASDSNGCGVNTSVSAYESDNGDCVDVAIPLVEHDDSDDGADDDMGVVSVALPVCEPTAAGT